MSDLEKYEWEGQNGVVDMREISQSYLSNLIGYLRRKHERVKEMESDVAERNPMSGGKPDGELLDALIWEDLFYERKLKEAKEVWQKRLKSIDS